MRSGKRTLAVALFSLWPQQTEHNSIRCQIGGEKTVRSTQAPLEMNECTKQRSNKVALKKNITLYGQGMVQTLSQTV